MDINDLQNVPWPFKFRDAVHQDARAYKWTEHFALHIARALGNLLTQVHVADHGGAMNRFIVEDALADIMVGAMRIAVTYQDGPIDLDAAVREWLARRGVVTEPDQQGPTVKSASAM